MKKSLHVRKTKTAKLHGSLWKYGFSLLAFAGLFLLLQPSVVRADPECSYYNETGDHMWLTQMADITYPTCTDQGIVPQKCEYCGAMKYSYMPAYGHEYHENGNTKAATCGSDGWIEYECALCGDTYHVPVPAPPHNYVLISNLMPDCYTEGYETYRCTVCGDEYTDILPKADHSWELSEMDSEAPTCVSEGHYLYRCVLCGAEEKTILPKTDHHYQTYKEEQGDCQHEGYQLQHCIVCGDEKKVSLGYGDHKYGNWFTQTEATDHSAGIRARTCSVCGRQETSSFYPDGTLSRGNSSQSTADLQTMLIDLHYLNDTADGVFGGNTENAVKAFQTANGLSADGIAWPQTINAVRDLWAKEKNPQPEEPVVETTVCRVVSDGQTSTHFEPCSAHKLLFDQMGEEILAGNGTPEAVARAEQEWEKSLDGLYEKWESITQYPAAVKSARESFYKALDLQDQILSGAGQQKAAEWRLMAVINETMRLCILLNE